MPEALRGGDSVGVRSSACGISLKYLIGTIVGTTVALVAVGTGIRIAFVALPAIDQCCSDLDGGALLRVANPNSRVAIFVGPSDRTGQLYVEPSFTGIGSNERHSAAPYDLR